MFSLLVFSSFAYSDVDETYQFSEAINYITDLEIVQGYEDGTYRPDNSINRAEFTKILVEAKISENPVDSADQCFSDINIADWFSSYVCYAKSEEIISGYPDGTFGPANNINLAEASKILVNVFEINQIQPVGTEWYSVYIETLANENYIPNTFIYINQEVTRGEMAEMIWRILEDNHDQASVAASDLQNSPCQPLGEDLPSNINMDIVRDTWLSWNNEARTAEGLHLYVLNDQLNRSATAWTEFAEDRGYMDHKRPGSTDYYDYWAITAWYADLGLTFENVYGVTHSENIDWGPYNCSESEPDCTQDLISKVRNGFNFYMAEKGDAYSPHYDSVMNGYFNEIGFGISIDPEKNMYYMTVHYGTRITSDPLRICD